MADNVDTEQRVTPLELFFDLVFVFALTQVTGLMAADPSWSGLGEGMLVLAALWWAWAAYAWLTNTLDPQESRVRLAMLAAMAAMLLAALAVPDAFGDDALLFGLAYLVVKVLHIALYIVGTRGDADVLAAVRRMTPTATIGPAFILLAAAFDGSLQAALWIVALALDYLGVLIGRGSGWRVSPAHFAERHGLIVIIAIGESIVAIGAAGFEIDMGIIVAAVLGILVAAALWWAYFDFVVIVAEQELAKATGTARAAMARDGWSYLHLPMVAGIILFALGMKKTLGDVDDALSTIPAIGLCGGVALYLLAHIAFRRRTVGGLGHGRPLAAVVLLALLPVALEVPALAALALVAAVCSALIAYESLRYREATASLRRATASPA